MMRCHFMLITERPRGWRRLCCLFLAACLLLSCVYIETVASTRPTAIQPDEYWGRTQLASLSNSKALLYAYDQLAAGIESCEEEITLRSVFRGYSITLNEFNTVLHAYLRDYPHHFWIGNAYYYSTDTHNSQIITAFLPTYILTGSALTAARAKFDAAVEAVMANVTTSMTEPQREKYLHDYLAQTIEYVGGTTHAHNAYGALVEGQSVCEGYAEAFQYLLYQSGILCATVTGEGYTGDSDVPEAHAWSLVRIDGDYYYVDLTWNDQTVATFYTYYNLTTEELYRDHVLDDLAYDYPACTATKANYFVMYGGLLNEFDVSVVTNAFNRDGYYAQVRLADPDMDFWTMFSQNRSSIVKQINIIGTASFSCYTLLDVRLVLLKGTRRGDTNNDSALNKADISTLLAHIDGSTPITEKTPLAAADVNQDGVVNILDHQRLYQHLTAQRYISPTGQDLPTASTQTAALTIQPLRDTIAAEDGSIQAKYTVRLSPPAGLSVHALSFELTLPDGVQFQQVAFSDDSADLFEVTKQKKLLLMFSGNKNGLTSATDLAVVTLLIEDRSLEAQYTLSAKTVVCGSNTETYQTSVTAGTVTVKEMTVVPPDEGDDPIESTPSSMTSSAPSVPSTNTSSAPIVSSTPSVSSTPNVSSTPSSSDTPTSDPSDPPLPPQELQPGDLDGNHQVSANDALCVLKYVVGKITLSPEQMRCGDLNHDNAISAVDALLVLQIVVGKFVPA